MWLVVVSEGQPERAVEVTGSRFLIGRGGSCDLVLDDAQVSREHAVIVPGPPGRRILQDLDSANGTLVNGRPIPGPIGFTRGPDRVAELWGEERLQFGDTLVVTTTEDPEPQLSQWAQEHGDEAPGLPPRPDIGGSPH
jgi:pSer/pThr/pTyr-binding forkhead associated (FHA) protein